GEHTVSNNESRLPQRNFIRHGSLGHIHRAQRGLRRPLIGLTAGLTAQFPKLQEPDSVLFLWRSFTKTMCLGKRNLRLRGRNAAVHAWQGPNAAEQSRAFNLAISGLLVCADELTGCRSPQPCH